MPAGQAQWPLLGSGVAPAQKAETADAPDAVAATFATQTLRPKKLTGRYTYTVVQAAEVPDIEPALRRDLGDAVRAQMSNQAVNGTGANGQVNGLLSRIAAPGDPPAESDFEDYAGVHALAVDGIHAGREAEVSSVIGVETFRHAAKQYGTGGEESGLEAMTRRSAMCQASSFIPDATNADIQAGNLLHAGMDECAVIPSRPCGRRSK